MRKGGGRRGSTPPKSPYTFDLRGFVGNIVAFEGSDSYWHQGKKGLNSKVCSVLPSPMAAAEQVWASFNLRTILYTQR
jgi:hypothetical protein